MSQAQKRILITGATGNVGIAAIRSLMQSNTPEALDLIAGVRNQQKAAAIFPHSPTLGFTDFDFETPKTFAPALARVDRLFLLRPPHITDIKRHIEPLLDEALRAGVRELVFLSVLGAEKSKAIPHHKIEKAILKRDFSYIFLRPSYFMQNLTTTLLNDIRNKGRIFLPSGSYPLNWIDVEDIGKAAAKAIAAFDQHRNQTFDLTGPENIDLETVAKKLTALMERKITYLSPSLLQFFLRKRSEGIERGLIMAMIMVHYFPRFMEKPPITDTFNQLCGQAPTRLDEFLKREMKLFL